MTIRFSDKEGNGRDVVVVWVRIPGFLILKSQISNPQILKSKAQIVFFFVFDDFVLALTICSLIKGGVIL